MEENKSLPTNWKHIAGCFYLVRTQAGFRNALRHYQEGDKSQCRGYPKSYPALVCFSHGEYFVVANTVHINPIRAALEGQ